MQKKGDRVYFKLKDGELVVDDFEQVKGSKVVFKARGEVPKKDIVDFKVKK